MNDYTNEVEKEYIEVNNILNDFQINLCMCNPNYEAKYFLKIHKFVKEVFSNYKILYEDNKFLRSEIEEKVLTITEQNNENMILLEKLNNSVNLIQTQEKDIDEKYKDRFKYQESVFQEQLYNIKHNLKYIEEIKNSQIEKIKILEIEKEELILKNEQLEEYTEKTSRLLSSLNKTVSQKDKEIKNLKEEIENNKESSKITEQYGTHTTDNSNSPRRNSYSTNIHQNYDSLFDICPELDITEYSSDVTINLTSRDVVRRMSMSVIPERINTEIKVKKEGQKDLYKEFFLLTLQAMKINSDDKEAFKYIKPLELYKEIRNKNIPFHEFYNFINTKIKKGSSIISKLISTIGI